MSAAIFVLCVIAAFAVDQTSKIAAVAFQLHAGARLPARARGRVGRLVALWCVEVTTLLAIVELVPLFRDAVPSAALGVAVGGAAGNVFDRVARGRVVDFIDLGWWPVFNLADVAIVAGVGVTLLSVI
jgi:lipoprotein signal peptidase